MGSWFGGRPTPRWIKNIGKPFERAFKSIDLDRLKENLIKAILNEINPKIAKIYELSKDLDVRIEKEKVDIIQDFREMILKNVDDSDPRIMALMTEVDSYLLKGANKMGDKIKGEKNKIIENIVTETEHGKNKIIEEIQRIKG